MAVAGLMARELTISIWGDAARGDLALVRGLTRASVLLLGTECCKRGLVWRRTGVAGGIGRTGLAVMDVHSVASASVVVGRIGDWSGPCRGPRADAPHRNPPAADPVSTADDCLAPVRDSCGRGRPVDVRRGDAEAMSRGDVARDRHDTGLRGGGESRRGVIVSRSLARPWWRPRGSRGDVSTTGIVSGGTNTTGSAMAGVAAAISTDV